MSSIVILFLRSNLETASTGPIPSNVGSTPIVMLSLNIKPSLNLCAKAVFLSIIISNTAPSFFIQQFPAVTVPSDNKGFKRLNVRTFNLSLMLSSLLNISPLALKFIISC